MAFPPFKRTELSYLGMRKSDIMTLSNLKWCKFFRNCFLYEVCV